MDFSNEEEWPLSPNKCTGALAILWRSIVAKMKMPQDQFLRLLDNYVEVTGIELDPSARSSYKGNILKSLHRDEMSWSVFLQAMTIINLTDIEIKMSVEHITLEDEHATDIITFIIPTISKLRKEKVKRSMVEMYEAIDVSLHDVLNSYRMNLGIGDKEFSKYLTRYAVDQVSKGNATCVNSAKGKIRQALDGNLTFPGFLKTMVALGANKMRINVAITTRASKQLSQAVSFTFD